MEQTVYYLEHYHECDAEKIAELEQRLEEAVRHIKKLERLPEEEEEEEAAGEEVPWSVPTGVLHSTTTAQEDEEP